MGHIIPDYIQHLFWDVKKESVDINRHARFIIRRVLDYGDVRAINWLRKVYSDATIKEVVQIKKGLLRKTQLFWIEHYSHN